MVVMTVSDAINISIGGKWHFYDIVAAASEMGELNHFYTTIYFKGTKVANSKLGRKLKLSNRHSDFFPDTTVVSNWIPEVYPKLLSKIAKVSEGKTLLRRCEMFDDWTAKKMDKCRIFHSQDGFCLKTAKRMKEKGAVFICDRGIISASYLKHLSEQEYGRYGINKVYADCFIQDRTHEEHELANCILVPTETVKRSLIDEGICADKIQIIPYGVDLSFFADVPSKKKDSGKFSVLFVGEISFRKGCHYLLNAWSHLNLKDAELILIGHVEPEFSVFLDSYTGRNYRIISYIAQQELLKYYQEASMFILPSLAEGSARVIYEAMACSLPVVYTDMAGSVARNGVDGFEIPSFNSEAIEEKIVYLYNHRTEGVEMGENGKQWIKNYSKEKYREKIQSVYLQYL